MMGFFVFITLRMHYLYIIFSNSLNKFYVGESHNIEERLFKHNMHSYKGAFSKIANDWHIVLSKNCNSKKEALFLEAFIKRMKSKKFILKIIDNPAILDDILSKK